MYKALTGIDYTTKLGEEARVEAGEMVDDLLETSIEWLLEAKAIEKVAVKKTPRKKTGDKE